ncbi:MAG: hypothetical protein CVT92_00470 [Bacteroidetes bacterium HGW-Bacteroidetes-1]|nr:MAG: hypothetical protein CVT92_00470 [Bacteroidetes bacterium HGW-Bacteroidetes-1]
MTIYRLFIFLAIILCTTVTTVGQANFELDNRAFDHGEEIEYTVSYNWGFIWIDAGKVDFKAQIKYDNQKKSWHFLSTGISFRKFDWFFKVRDTFEVISNYSDLKPIWFKRNTQEGNYFIFNEYNFDHKNGYISMLSSETKKGFSIDTIPLPKETFDVLTATYIARSMDFSKTSKYDTTGIKMVLDGIIFTLPIVFYGRETIINRDGKKYDCIKFGALLEEGTMFRSGEIIYVWVTADRNQIPVMIEAKIKVGSIKVYLSSYRNLKFPLLSLYE